MLSLWVYSHANSSEAIVVVVEKLTNKNIQQLITTATCGAARGKVRGLPSEERECL